MDFKIRIFLLLVMCGLSHLSGSAQSNLVFVDQYSVTQQFSKTLLTNTDFANHQLTFTIPDSCVFKVTSTSFHMISDWYGGYEAMELTDGSYTIISDQILMDEAISLFHKDPYTSSNGRLFVPSYSTNLWIGEGDHDVQFVGENVGVNVVMGLSGVLYKKVPIE